MSDISFYAAFLAGLVSFLSPCVLPLVPPYLSYLAGSSLESLQNGEQHLRRRTILIACSFVAGFSTVFVTLGATASVLGYYLRHYMETLGLLAGIAIIIMGLHFLGLLRINFLYREKRFRPQKPPGFLGAYIMGLAFAFGWTPCIGPVLASILALAGSEANVERGVTLLGIYSLGLGLPFLLTALAAQPFAVLMKRVKSRLDLVEKLMGLALVATGIAFLSGGLTTASFWLLETFPALGTLG